VDPQGGNGGALRKIAFIKRGPFSHLNAGILEQLRKHFGSGYEIEVLDIIESFLRTHPWVAARNLLEIARLYAPQLLSRRQTFRSAFYRTPYLARAIRDFIVGRLAPRAHEFAFTLQTQSLFDAHLPGVPHFVYTDHTHLANLRYPSFDSSRLFAPAWIECERAIYHHATLNLVMGSHVEQSLVEDYGVSPDRAVTVPVGSNIAPQLIELDNDGFQNGVILFVGIDWERKGGPTLVAAFERLAQRHLQARLVLVGCDPPVKHPRIEVIGRLPLAGVEGWLRRASVFCLPSRIEPFGVAPIEALMHGIPVVATRIGALPDIVCDGSGYLVVPDDADALEAALADLVSDPEKCRRFGQHGREHVLRHFTWDASGERMAAAIRSKLAGS
jgi:glycosyltransferase involved in cell wall biosynthesis